MVKSFSTVFDLKGRILRRRGQRPPTSFAMIDQEMAEKSWAMDELFSMADCAAAPALGYCRMIYPFTRFKNVAGYMNRLAERPSFQRVLKEAEPYLKTFGK
jgi:glutathione S-transferase